MSQYSWGTMNANVESGTQLATDLNGFANAVESQHSGSTRPSYAQAGIRWLNTSSSAWGVYTYDGTNDIYEGTFDSTNHIWQPVIGGGVSSLSSAATTDLGSVPGARITINGSVTITSFGSTAGVGQVKILTFGASLTVTNNSNIFSPTGANIAVSQNDQMVVQCTAAGQWAIVAYTPANTGTSRFSGELIHFAGLNTPTGWLPCDGSAVSRSTFGSLFSAISIQTVGDTTNGSKTVANLGTTTGLVVGMLVCGTNIPASTYITSISGTSVTLNNAATGTSTQQSFIAAPWGVGNGTTTFNVPDLRGYTLTGLDLMNGNTANVSQITNTISTTNLSTAATVGSAAGLAIGMYVASVNVPFGTTITAISGTSITLSNAATATASGVSARFSPYQDATLLGANGGSLTHTMQVSEMPAHNHSASVTDPQHNHTFQEANTTGTGIGATGSGAPRANVTDNTGSSSTGISVTTANTGGGAPHLIYQPSKAVNILVKT